MICVPATSSKAEARGGASRMFIGTIRASHGVLAHSVGRVVGGEVPESGVLTTVCRQGQIVHLGLVHANESRSFTKHRRSCLVGSRVFSSSMKAISASL